MPLSTIVPPIAVIEYENDSFEVRGLSLSDITRLVKPFQEDFEKLFEGQMDLESLLTDSPELAAHIIAFAAGEPDQVDTVKSLPFGLQLIALEKVWDMTAVDAETVGKVLSNLVSGVNRLAEERTEAMA